MFIDWDPISYNFHVSDHSNYRGEVYLLQVYNALLARELHYNNPEHKPKQPTKQYRVF